MSQTTCTKQNIPQEKPKTKKYIVEADEPKEGQEVSTGGVRDKGKMVSQFKNPIPYEDPVPTPVNKNTDIVPSASAPSQCFKTRIRDEVQELAIDVGRDIAYSLWDDFLKPFIRAKLAQAVDWFLSPPMNNTDIESNGITSHQGEVIIDVEPEELTPIYNSDKIVPFPKKSVG